MTARIEDVEVQLSNRLIVSGITIDIEEASMVGIVGPNGSGKSTLLRTVYRAIRPHRGTVYVNGHDVWRIPPHLAARNVGAVCQDYVSTHELTVLELVELGRFPHKTLFSIDTDRDRQLVWDAIDKVGLRSLAMSPLSTLSGGERQRALIAKGLAQEPQLLVLDEPTNHLDIRYQMEVLKIVRRLKITTLVTLHDLNLAATFCDRLYLISDGHVFASGRPEAVLTPETVQKVYGMRVVLTSNPLNGGPLLVFDPECLSTDEAVESRLLEPNHVTERAL